MFSCFKCGAYDLIMKVGFDHHGCSVGALEEIREAFKGGDGAPGPVGKREIAGRGDVGAAYGESVYVIRLAYDFSAYLLSAMIPRRILQDSVRSSALEIPSVRSR